MNRTLFLTSCASVAGLVLLAQVARAQVYPANTYVVPYPNIYAGQAYTGYTGFYTTPYGYNVVRSAYNPMLATYPPSINYPAYPTRGFNYAVPTYPPSINYPALINPTTNLAIPANVPVVEYPMVGGTALAVPSTGVVIPNYSLTTPLATTGVVSTGYYGSTVSPLASAVPQLTTNYAASPTLAPSPLAYATASQNLTNAFSTFNLQETSANEDRSEVSTGLTAGRRTRQRQPRTTAFIDIRIPASAELWFQGVKTRQKGTVRRFETPRLARGRTYAYDVRVAWKVKGKRVTQRRQVKVRAGDWVRLDMSSPSSRFTSTTNLVASR
jgi:uncharacterized protein (TIGR03000 family)